MPELGDMMNNLEKTLETKFQAVTADGAAVRTDWNDHDEPLVAIAETVAAFRNERPTELPPLGNVIDGDALKQLFVGGSEEANTVFTFGYQGLEVTITRAEILIIETARVVDE